MKKITILRIIKWGAPIILIGFLALLFSKSRKSEVSTLIAPFLHGQFYCDSAINNNLVKNSDDAAFLCAAKAEDASGRINKTLDEIGPPISPSGHYQLGYTMEIPLFRYYKKDNGQWVFDQKSLLNNLSTISNVDRPVVLYLSSNHFVDSNESLASDLAKDPRNLMWTRDGPLNLGGYFGVPTVAWNLDDSEAPVNILRKKALRSTVDAICNLPATSLSRIAAVSVLGETHQLFPNFQNGQNFEHKMFNAGDYSPVASRGFQAWLSQKYVKIDVLNRDIGSNFTSFNSIKPPSKDIRADLLENYFEHIDPFAAGFVPIFGWINDKLGRKLEVSIFLDGAPLAKAQYGLSRTDITDAISSISNPNVGFRINLDYRNIPYGIHTLEIVVSADGLKPLRLTRQNLVIVDRSQNKPEQIKYVDSNLGWVDSDKNISGYTDSPLPSQSLFYNPLAQLWLEYRNQVVRNYLEQYAMIVKNSCLKGDKIFSHQITPSLNGSWNADLIAADASKLPSAVFNQGTTLYGGAAFGEAFLAMKKQLGWSKYAVNEINPIIPLTNEQYLKMFEMHRMNGAAFISPYYISILPSDGRGSSGASLEKFRIADDNKNHGSNLYWQSLKELMRH
jgi:Beta-galactosidase